MSLLAEATLEYWKASQHLNALPGQAERETYALVVLTARRDRAEEPNRIRLLSRLIDGVLAAAA